MEAYRVTWIPNTHMLCVGGFDGLVRIWNLRTDRIDILRPEAGNVWALAVSPNTRTLAIGTQDGALELYRLATRQKVAALPGHITWVGELGFSPDSRCLISSGGDANRIWRAAANVTAETASGNASPLAEGLP